MNKLGSFGKFVLVAVLALGYHFVTAEHGQEQEDKTEQATTLEVQTSPQAIKRGKIMLARDTAIIDGFLSQYVKVVSPSAQIVALPERGGNVIRYLVKIKLKSTGKHRPRPETLISVLANTKASETYHVMMDILDEDGLPILELGSLSASKNAVDALLYGDIPELNIAFSKRELVQGNNESFLKNEFLHTLDLKKFRVYSY